ncbi:MAG TPA: hypothetical protein PJ982_03585, partial [Lacipirellulaceae bacterium]|nr:hypothetical protein [Lacipirellulaceae bacterium]
ALAEALGDAQELDVIVDRLTSGPESAARLRDSLESALEAGRGAALVLTAAGAGAGETIDDRPWRRRSYSRR